MTSHFADTGHCISESTVRKSVRDKKVRRDVTLRRKQKMEQDGAAVMCDGRLFHGSGPFYTRNYCSNIIGYSVLPRTKGWPG